MNRITLLVGFLLGLLAAIATPRCSAADIWISATLASYHTNRQVEHNERNPGLGIEYQVAEDWRLVGGVYRNSYYETSVYAGALWLPLQAGPTRLGLTLVGATGYTHAVDPIVLPTIAIEGKTLGVNIGVMPALDSRIINVIGLQVKARF